MSFELNSIINAGDDYAPPRLKSCKPAARRTPAWLNSCESAQKFTLTDKGNKLCLK